ncbi:type II toxin-antitoxin system Phd/YefM family antitoxin [Dialister sp.]|uniref:type II toxin-antitoxin system Phd/YefM family antitoxin n=1 Tax=Dialister sp. TaxID=1955814 RepID=UPI002E8221C9|nr:type II toxin-antitoxin system prevent-host-death family antitoxin [Dialister sp.]MEE3453407.1 type II toxin-antitoxin system prevent-host-death family antitoxin [Dialister sp.]
METTATATEMKNNFGKYLDLVMNGHEVIVTRNGKEVGRLIPKAKSITFLTDSLTGILKGTGSIESARDEALREKYENID